MIIYSIIFVLCLSISPHLKKKILMRGMDISVFKLITSAFVLLASLIFYLIEKPDMSKLTKLDYGWACIASIFVLLPSLMSLYLIKNNDVNSLSVYLQPLILVMTVFMGYMFFQSKKMNLHQIGAITLILLGMYIFISCKNS